MRKIKRRESKPRKIKRRNKKNNSPNNPKHHYFLSYSFRPKCLNCFIYPNKYLTVSNRITLCPKCFKKYFIVIDSDSAIPFAEEKQVGIAEKLHKNWMTEFKNNGGEMVSWQQKLDYVLNE